MATDIAAASTHINRTLWLQYDDLPPQPERATVEGQALVRRNLFYRFFGLGADSNVHDQSSYTRTTALHPHVDRRIEARSVHVTERRFTAAVFAVRRMHGRDLFSRKSRTESALS